MIGLHHLLPGKVKDGLDGDLDTPRLGPEPNLFEVGEEMPKV